VSLIGRKAALILLLLTLSRPAVAQGWGTVDVKSGFGDEVKVHHGLFGTRDTEVKDRLGDGFIDKKGYFGTKDEGVSVLGNGYQKHRGLIGGTQVEARDIFGDKVASKKTFLGLGPRVTSVDFSGVGSIVQQFAAGHLNTRMPTSGMVPMGGNYGGASSLPQWTGQDNRDSRDRAQPEPQRDANPLDAQAGLISPDQYKLPGNGTAQPGADSGVNGPNPGPPMQMMPKPYAP